MTTDESIAYRLLADLVLLLHFGFILFVVLGGCLALKWPRVTWAHLPSAAWGALVELLGWTCPLTPAENWLRARGGREAYRGDFIEHYLLPVVYPEGLTREIQLVLGGAVVLVNVVIYRWVLRRSARRPTS